jgi:tetratricopeptide (TPR) repeat protein
MSGSDSSVKGKHDRETYVQVLLGIAGHRLSGKLVVSVGRRHRTICLVYGQPILYQSDLDEEALAQTVVNAKLIPRKRMNWVVEKLGPGENLRDALVLSGAITAAQLEEHQEGRMRIGLGAPLTWARGEWVWTPIPEGLGGRIDPALRRDLAVLPALWHSVQQHLAMDDVLPLVMNPALGDLRTGEGLAEGVASLELDSGLSTIVDALETGCSVDALAGTVPDRAGDLLKLVWMLQLGGLIVRENDPDSASVVAQVLSARFQGSSPGSKKTKKKKAASPTPKEAAQPAKAARLDDAAVAAEHKRCMGQDFYTFLGIDADSSPSDIKRACNKMAKTWRNATVDKSLSGASRLQAQEMAEGVQLVLRTFTDDGRKAEYDRRLASGRAPAVEPIRVASLEDATSKAAPPPQPPPQSSGADESLAQRSLIRALMDKGDHKDALAMLRQLRLEDPSDPDTLADLGWAEWRTKGLPAKSSEESEEYLRLALTFNPTHRRAMEYHARIAMDMGQVDEAKVRLKRILEADSGASWARQAIRDLDSPDPNASKGGRFWRKGGG